MQTSNTIRDENDFVFSSIFGRFSKRVVKNDLRANSLDFKIHLQIFAFFKVKSARLDGVGVMWYLLFILKQQMSLVAP